jgi:hypothetical protein
MRRKVHSVDLVLIVCPSGVLVSYDTRGGEYIAGGMAMPAALKRVNQAVDHVKIRPMTQRTGATLRDQP